MALCRQASSGRRRTLRLTAFQLLCPWAYKCHKLRRHLHPFSILFNRRTRHKKEAIEDGGSGTILAVHVANSNGKVKL